MILDGNALQEILMYVPILNEEETNRLYDSCRFNEITEGYLIAVLDEMEVPKEKIVEAIEKLRFDFTYLGANEIKAIRKGFLEGMEKEK